MRPKKPSNSACKSSARVYSVKISSRYAILIAVSVYVACLSIAVLHMRNVSKSTVDGQEETFSASQVQFKGLKQRMERKMTGIQPSQLNGGRKMTGLQPSELKLPTPIIVMGLMKAGTTSILGYFHCGLDMTTSRLSHYDCSPPTTRMGIPTKGGVSAGFGMACGKRMRRNIQKYYKPAFDTFEDFHLYAELDAQENNGGMTLPQYLFVNEIHEQFPDATWILNLRDPRAWLSSVDRWKDLRQRFIDHDARPYHPDFPKGKGAKDEEMIAFYNMQAQRIRDFVKNHTSHTLVEVKIDDPSAGRVMEDAFGITRNCWGNRNINNGSAAWSLDGSLNQ